MTCYGQAACVDSQLEITLPLNAHAWIRDQRLERVRPATGVLTAAFSEGTERAQTCERRGGRTWPALGKGRLVGCCRGGLGVRGHRVRTASGLGFEGRDWDRLSYLLHCAQRRRARWNSRFHFAFPSFEVVAESMGRGTGCPRATPYSRVATLLSLLDDSAAAASWQKTPSPIIAAIVKRLRRTDSLRDDDSWMGIVLVPSWMTRRP